MNAEEASAFEEDPDKDDCVKIRFWDDLGKDENISVDQEDLNRLKILMSAYLEISSS
jgi:predicted HD phosphohydrolase